MGCTSGCNPEHMPPPRALWAAVCRPAKWGGRTALPFSGYPANSHAPAIWGCRSSARGLPAVPNMPGTCPCSLPAVAAHATAASHSNRFAEPKATAILPRKPTGFGRAGAVCLARGAAARPLANRRNPRPRRSRVLRLIPEFRVPNRSREQGSGLTKEASLPSFWLRAAPPRRRLAACAAARLTQAGNRVERAGQPALGARTSPVGAAAAWMSGHGANGFPRSLREPPRPSRAVDVRRRRGARRAAPGLLSARGGRGGPFESPAARGGSCAAATSAAISPVWLARGGSPRRFAGSAVRSCRRRSR